MSTDTLHPVRCLARLEKFDTPDNDLLSALYGVTMAEATPATLDAMRGRQAAAALRELRRQGLRPYEVTEHEHNLLMYGGASAQWQTLIGNGTTTAGQALTYFNNTNAAVGVGDSSTAAAATQTNLQATTNKLRKAMDSTYPQHSDGVVVGSASVVFRSTFGSSEANFAWAEWGLFNSATDGTGRMLNRKVESNGTKASGASWQFTITLSLA